MSNDSASHINVGVGARQVRAFCYGAMLEEPVQEAVLGRVLDLRRATLRGHRLASCPDGYFGILPDPQSVVVGAIVELTHEEVARLDRYEQRRYAVRLLPIYPDGEDSPIAARSYLRRAPAGAAPVEDATRCADLPLADLVEDARASLASDGEMHRLVVKAVRSKGPAGLTGREIVAIFPQIKAQLQAVGKQLLAARRLVPNGATRAEAPVYVVPAVDRAAGRNYARFGDVEVDCCAAKAPCAEHAPPAAAAAA